MRRTSSLAIVLLSLLTAACAVTPSPNPTATAPATVAAPTRPADTAAPPTPTATPDPCADATSPGARERYTLAEITPCLNTPQRLVAFTSSNLRWDGGWDARTYGDNAYPPAEEVYENGVDDCDGLAEFAACVLSRNGYEAYNVGISILGPSGHNVAGYVDRDGYKYGINNGQRIDGPFGTWEELAQFYIDDGSAAPADGVLWLFDPCISVRAVGDAVLGLPHTVLR